jgi:hypothetical protein
MPDSPMNVEWGPCCFCSEGIEPTEADPIRITAETREGKWQVWFAHGECFKGQPIRPAQSPTIAPTGTNMTKPSIPAS